MQPRSDPLTARRRRLPKSGVPTGQHPGWALVALMLMVGASGCAGAPQRPVSQAPDLTLPSLKGPIYSLRAQAGHVVVLDFMSSWCQTCTEALPGVERMAKGWHAKGVRVWVVSIDEDRADLEAVLKRVPVALPVLMDSREVWFKHFGLSAVPTAVVLGRDGRVVAVVNEPPGSERYEDAIEAVLRRTP